jgi:hypothetical protein
MTPPEPLNEELGFGFGVELWGFAGGHGIAAKSLSPMLPIMHYNSGDTTWSHLHVETIISPATTNHVIKIIPLRQSWFTTIKDPDRNPEDVLTAIEERSFESLQRIYRYETRFIEDPTPTAFAVDAENRLLYVAYSQRAFLEVFCLP